MKIAPIYRQIVKDSRFEFLLVHSGQHYDPNMSDIFFDDLALPEPNFHLGVSGGSQNEQLAKVILELDPLIASIHPNMTIVVGDVNATVAAAIASANRGIPVAHVESGLRSGDFSMPEERNRIITDSLSSLHFVSEISGIRNLEREGVSAKSIHFVGNVMIDSLLHQKQFAKVVVPKQIANLKRKSYIVITMHRPSNVDSIEGLQKIAALVKLVEATGLSVVFPVHPRTKNAAELMGVELATEKTITTPPLGYSSFVDLLENSAGVITDSGGIQEEASFLKIPCITFRTNTERPVTVQLGTNRLVPSLDPEVALGLLVGAINNEQSSGTIPHWDGKASERIVGALSHYFFGNCDGNEK